MQPRNPAAGPPLPPPPPLPPHLRQRGAPRWMLIVAGAAVLALILFALVVWFVAGKLDSPKPPETDEARLSRLAADFALAVDQSDQTKALSLMCTEEVAEFKDSDEYDPEREGVADPSASGPPVTLSGIVVTGDVAQGTVSRPGQESNVLHFRKENGAWTVCAPAGDQPEPSTSPS